jgi:hypothetical protein
MKQNRRKLLGIVKVYERRLPDATIIYEAMWPMRLFRTVHGQAHIDRLPARRPRKT